LEIKGVVHFDCQKMNRRLLSAGKIERPLSAEVPMTMTLEFDLPADISRFRLPEAVAARLQALLDRRNSGRPLSAQERDEAEGLVELAELLTLLRLRAERLTL
jgi:hypothetical protein